MNKTIESGQSSPGSKDLFLDLKKLKIADTAQLERGLSDRLTYASNSVRELEIVTKGQKVKRNDQVFNKSIVAAIDNISLAKNLGLDVADLEKRFDDIFQEKTCFIKFSLNSEFCFIIYNNLICYCQILLTINFL